MKLRANSAVQELVDAFKGARSMLLQLGQNSKPAKSGGRGEKRKIEKTDLDTDIDEDDNAGKDEMNNRLQRRKTRSGTRRRSISDGIDKDRDSQPGLSAQKMPFLTGLILNSISRGRLSRVSHLWVEDEGGSSISSFRCTQQFNLYHVTSEVDTRISLPDKQTDTA